MEYEIRNYSSYDDDPRFVVRSDTGNISNISDRMVRLAAKITESYAGCLLYTSSWQGSLFFAVTVFQDMQPHFCAFELSPKLIVPDFR